METRMTPTARSQGFQNAALCALGVCGTWLAIAGVVSLVTSASPTVAGLAAFAILWGCTLVTFVAGWAYGLSRRGALLLDCGGHPTRWLFLANAATFTIFGLIGSFASHDAWGRSGAVFALSFGAYWVLMGLGRLEVRERGIWTYWGLMKWDRIQAYSWAKDGTLILRTTGPLSFLSRAAIPVPNECLAEFQQLLLQRSTAVVTV